MALNSKRDEFGIFLTHPLAALPSRSIVNARSKDLFVMYFLKFEKSLRH